MAIEDNTTYGLTGAQIKDLVDRVKDGLTIIEKQSGETRLNLYDLAPGEYYVFGWNLNEVYVGASTYVKNVNRGDSGFVLIVDKPRGATNDKRVTIIYVNSLNWAYLITSSNYSTNNTPATSIYCAPPVNSLTSTSTSDSLSANQGKVLKGLIDALDVNFTGTDGTNAGAKGLVPAPATTDTNKYLKSDGTWATVSTGPTYTAGNGLNLQNNQFSINPTVVATKTDLADKVDKVEGKGLSTNDFTNSYMDKLNGISAGAEPNVRADWAETSLLSEAFILNKPNNLVQDANYVHTDNNFTTTLKDKLDGIASGAEVNVQANWNESDTTADSYIQNKPQNLVTDASYVHTDNNFTTALKNKLDGIASGAEVNVQSNWNETDNTADSYIQNKPDVITLTLSTTDIGEGAVLAANTLYGVYE